MADIRFHINGKEHIVPRNLPVTTSLNEYLRETAGLSGTKVMCREAGCGCCAVTVTHLPPDSQTMKTYSVQSCLTPLYAVDGWQISTVEGIGSQTDGFHPIQERIAKFNGTQCGYCTPGMVMNMYGLLHQKAHITAQDVEDNFDGNICRCTGYRPILDAMKSFSEDANIPGRKTIDIEDLNKNLCPKTGESCSGSCWGRNLDLEVGGARWYRPTSLAELGKVMLANKSKKTRLVFGNTSTGIFKNDGPFEVYVDLHRVKELFSFEVSETRVKLGAATTLTQYLDILKSHQDKPGFSYFSQIHKHIKVVANVMVRNSGSIAGNLMIKRQHKEFPSDVFTTLEAAGAEVLIFDSATSKEQSVSLLDFLKVNMANKVLVAVSLPKLAENFVYRSFKITPRSQNAHAYVNAGFKIPVKGQTVQGKPSIVLGGISADMIHAKKTEDFLTNKTLSLAVVKEACSTLRAELVPTESPLESSPKYRKDLATGLLYKVLLGLCNSKNPKLRSGSENLHRPVSSGLQTYQEMRSEFPLKQALPKMTAPLQASGEAQFVNDMPKFQHELFAAFVTSDEASAKIASIDPSPALAMPGVAHFYSAKDTKCNDYPNPLLPSLFASDEVVYNGQPIGLILAETSAQAFEAAKKVKVTYSDVRPPILTIEDSVAQGKEFVNSRKTNVTGEPDEAWKSVDQIVEGTVSMGSQSHFYMETQVGLAVPSEDGINMYMSTQNSDLCQFAASIVIDQPMNYINITVPRVGGGFGGKSVDSSTVASAVSLAAFLSKRPVRLAVDLSTNLRSFAKRPPYKATYKAGFNKDGKVQVIEIEMLMDVGFHEGGAFFTAYTMGYMDMCYHVPNWKVTGRSMMTNKRVMTAVRAPGSVPAALISESIFEHVAKALHKHPIILKELNLYQPDQKDLAGHVLVNCTVRELWRRLKDTAEVDARIRHTDAFNQENLWKKRGITMTTCKYGMSYFGSGHGATVTIFGRDGSVQISQGGVEMGQGLYTKVAQGVAHVLGIPLDKIKVRPNQGIISPNNLVSGGSIASESSLQPRREDSVARTVQPASPVSSDERGEGQFRWKPQGFCWEYSSGVALALIALESRACVPLLDSLEGSVPAALISESIFEHVAKALHKHPIILKELNLYQPDQKDLAGHVLVNCTVRELWRRLKDTAEVDARIRHTDAFNQENLWKKRGITMTTCKYGMSYFGSGHGATVTIFGRDGSVQISQGGVEMGQGLYTKVAQGVAHVLGIPLDKIKVRPNQGIISPNNLVSGGSIASESSLQAAIGAAEILKERMRPIREKFPDADWKELCQKSAAGKVDLTARFLNQHQMGSPFCNYHTYCVAVTETEVDVLTGESHIKRVDIMADYGESLNPMIDIGQTEGGFVMGLGCFLTEDTVFDAKDGRILNDGTWNYKPPTTKDIPIDWRVHLLPDTPNPSGVRSSKATGEPSIALSVGGLLGNKLALESARKDLFDKDDFIPVVAPFTVEKAQQSVGLTEAVLVV